MGRLLTLIAALVAASLIAWTTQQPPKPMPVGAPATAFSAMRAFGDIRAFAAAPHPVGSPANHAARDYLFGRMAALGLSPEVRPGRGLQPSRPDQPQLLGGEVENLVGVLPGRDRAAPALALMAHYDSVPGSSGAADDAAGLASALEIVRAIRARGTPARDVMVLITDGEEAGLLGANAFFRRDPMARRVGFVLNMDVRGDAGRAQMFQTGPEGAGSADLLRRSAVRPRASSLSVLVYRHASIDTDFTESARLGASGLNFGFMGRQFDYHAPTSTSATLDLGALQDLGQQVLGPALAVAFADALPERGPDKVFSHLFGNVVVAYPPPIGWLVLLAAAGFVALAVARARRAAPFPWTDVARGAGAALFAALAAASVLHFARRATGAGFGVFEQRFLLAQVHRWEFALLLLGLGALLAAVAEIGRGRRRIAALPLAAGVGGCLFGGIDLFGLGLGVAAAVVGLAAYGRVVTRPGAWAGVLLAGLLLSTFAQALVPEAAFILAWPLLLAALAAAATDLSARPGLAPLMLLGAASAVGLGWLGGFAHEGFLALDVVELLAVAVAGAALLVWPLAQPAEGAPPERLIGPALLILGLAVTLAVRFNNPYNARFPKVSIVVYQQDQDARRAWLVSDAPAPTPWARSALKASGPTTRISTWLRWRPAEAAAAPYAPEPAPQISLARQADGGLSLRAIPPPGGRDISLGLAPDTPVWLEAVQGVALHQLLPPGQLTRLRWRASPQGVVLALRPAGPGRMVVRYNARLDGWPAGVRPLPSRPADVMAFGESDTTYLTGSRTLAW